MTPSKPQKRSVVKTTGIKIGLTLAAVGASIGGWATLGQQSLNATTVAQATTTQQTASTAGSTTNVAAATGSSNTASNTTSAATQSSSSTGTTSAATQSSSSNQSMTSIQPVARTSSSQ